MEKLKKLKAAYQVCVDQMQATLDSTEDTLTVEDQETFDGLKAKAAGLQVQIANYEQMAVNRAEATRLADAPNAPVSRQVVDGAVIMDDPTGAAGASAAAEERFNIPARAKRWSGRLQAFKGPDADRQAYNAGMFLAATLFGNRFAMEYCAAHGIGTDMVQFTGPGVNSLHQEGINTQGGYLVFDEMENTIIRLVESFGLARQLFKIVPMISDTKSQPRRTGGLDAFFIGEGTAITESTGSWDLIKLVAKKLGAIALTSNELISDAIIVTVDEIVREIALAFATKEDLCAFQGDGTSTFGGIEGVVPKLSRLNGVDDGGGLVLASGNLWSEITDGDLMKMIGRVPQFAGLMPEWTCSKPFWANVMVRLTRATGGATMAEFDGRPRQVYAGYPVNWTNGASVMPVVEGNSQIACLFGDLRMSSQFGDRAGMTIAISTDATVGTTKAFQADATAVRGIERFDINNHDLGTASATGPVLGLITASA